jgi:hypothetical protein
MSDTLRSTTETWISGWKYDDLEVSVGYDIVRFERAGWAIQLFIHYETIEGRSQELGRKSDDSYRTIPTDCLNCSVREGARRAIGRTVYSEPA